MSDCSSCTRPPCLTIVAEMLITYKKLVAASKMKYSAATSTIYDSVAYSKDIETCFAHSRGPLSWYSCAKISDLITYWCSISRTVRTNAFVNNEGLLLLAMINWSRSSLRTPAVHYIVSWPPSTSIWRYSHPIACCFPILLRLALHTIVKCASWAIFSVATIAVLQWTNWCLRCCCVSARGPFDEAPIFRLDLDSITPGWGLCGAMTCCCGNSEEDDNEKWKVLWNI